CCHTQTEALCLSRDRFTVENAPCLEDCQLPASLTDSLPRPFPNRFISPLCFTQLQLALITCLLGHTPFCFTQLQLALITCLLGHPPFCFPHLQSPLITCL